MYAENLTHATVFPYFFVGTFIEAGNQGNPLEELPISLLFRRDFH